MFSLLLRPSYEFQACILKEYTIPAKKVVSKMDFYIKRWVNDENYGMKKMTEINWPFLSGFVETPSRQLADFFSSVGRLMLPYLRRRTGVFSNS